MDIVIDVQFFKDNYNRVTPKEVAVVSLHGDFQAHWMIRPTSRIVTLKPDVRKQNDWLTQHHHGLDFLEGEVTLRTLARSLQNLTKKVGKIYVRGMEKYLIVHRITAREVVNLEDDIDCPSFSKLPWCARYCFHHAIKDCYLKYSCALNNAIRLREWLRSGSSILNSDNTFEPPVSLCDEQPTSSDVSCTDLLTYCGCIPGRSDTSNMDETNGICV